MSRSVQIRGDTAVFPGSACVCCLSATENRVELVRIKRSVVRRVQVPVCDECTALRRARSPAQVRFLRIGSVLAFLTAWAVGVWVYLWALTWDASVRRAPVWAALVGVLAVVAVFGLLYAIVSPWARHYRSPETVEALACVRIRGFDWETTTLEFADEAYAERFARVNQPAEERAAPVVGTDADQPPRSG